MRNNVSDIALFSLNIDKKIEDLIIKEKKEKLIGIASATIPIFIASYIVKKTYETLTKKN